MRQPRAKFSKYTIMNGSVRAKERYNHVVELAEKFQKDPDRKARMERQYCVPCHYQSRLGGAAMTSQECASCGSDQLYGSTATDTLCLECAKRTEACKCCGGDIKMRESRKNWPEGL